MLRLRAIFTLVMVSSLALSACGGDEDARLTPAAELKATASESSLLPTETSASAAGLVSTAPSDEPFDKNVPTLPPDDAQPTYAPRQSPFDGDEDGFYTFTELEQAVAALYPSYRWPENLQPDREAWLSGYAAYADQNPRFEVGFEYGILGGYHQCAWQMTWLEAFKAGDDGLMAESMEQLEAETLANPTFVYVRDHYASIFDRAKLGDPALMQQWVQTDCAGMRFLTATPRATT